MKKLINLFSLVIIFGGGSALYAFPVRADLMNPDFLTKKCQEGESEVICSYNSKEPFGPRIGDGCKKYANNSNYYYLTGHGSSFGGEEKYCLKAKTEDGALRKNKYVLIGGMVMVITILSLLSLGWIKKKGVK